MIPLDEIMPIMYRLTLVELNEKYNKFKIN